MLADSSLIANKFAAYFESTCISFSDQLIIEVRVQYNELRAHYQGCPIVENKLFNVELVDNLVDSVAKGNAGDLDELTIEHIQYSHPIIICILNKLFNMFITSAIGYIPVEFDTSYTVPIYPNAMGVYTCAPSVDDFRGIQSAQTFLSSSIWLFKTNLLNISLHPIISLDFKSISVV